MIHAASEVKQDLVLVGGGHAHALALRMLAMAPISGVRLTLISPATHTPYSGMLPGLVAGHYRFEETHIDLARLCQWAGVRFLMAEVTGIDPANKALSLKGRPQVHYDLLSIDIGSEPELDSVPGAREWAVPVKPVAGLWQRWLKLASEFSGQAGERRIAVVGGGAGSIELIMAMAQHRSGTRVCFDLYCGADDILSAYNRRARNSVRRDLSRLGIELHLGARVGRVEQKYLVLTGGDEREYDDLFWCTGAAASPWIAASGLPADESGFLLIRDTLQSTEHDNIFAAGDVATQCKHPRPKAGVYAVRQGPVLAHNLRNALLGKPLKNHIPQDRFLSLLSLGDKRATADRGLFSATGAWVWRWKDRIDREFMSRFQNLPEMSPDGNADHLPSEAHQSEQMPCGGCGAKIGAGSLANVLAGLAVEFPDHCPNGGRADDTAPIPGSSGQDIVQSIDVLREMTADPWLMGRIAANHALSDLYASGARPLSALATVTLPFAAPSIQERELRQLLAGALYEFSAANCMLQGGHSLQGQELNIGFVVNGTAMSVERGLLAKTDLNPGDHLLLTKPLGTGALFAAHMQLLADGRDIQAAIETMLQSNAQAAELMVLNGASAATDVTGFGLLGHLLEMLGEDQAARLMLSDVPLLAGALESIDCGVFSTMHEANSLAKNAIASTSPELNQSVLELLVDPQTSGGLLIGIAPDRSGLLCKELHAAGYTHTAIIGEVVARTDALPGQLIIE